MSRKLASLLINLGEARLYLNPNVTSKKWLHFSKYSPRQKNFPIESTLSQDNFRYQPHLVGYTAVLNCYLTSFNVKGRQYRNSNGFFLGKGRSSSTSTNKNPATDKSEEQDVQKLSLFKRFKTMYRDYWYVLVPVHVVTSIGWFGTFFYLAKSGVDFAAIAEALNLNESVVATIREKGNTTTGYLALSYFLYKIATPLRYTVTLGGTTLSINYLKKWGCIKPMPKKEELKKMLNNTREQLKEKSETYKKNLRSFGQKNS